MDTKEPDRPPGVPDRGQASGWEHLRVEGAVTRPLALTASDLAGLRREELVEDVPPKKGRAARVLAWEGVPVGEVLSAAGPLAEARYVTFSAGGFSMALTLAEAWDGNALLALRLNGQPLPPGRGGPCRLVGAGEDCWFSIKWLEHIEVTADRPVETAREIALRAVGQLGPPGDA